MKKFLIRVFLFMLSLTLLQLGLTLLCLFREKSYDYKILPEINKVIIGHSMTECAVNDTILKKSINISDSGVGFEYTYVKLRKCLNDNLQIDTIILGVKPNDFTCRKGYEFRDDYLYYKMQKYLFLFSMREVSHYFSQPIFYKVLCKIPFEYIVNTCMFTHLRHHVQDMNIGRYRTNFGHHIGEKADSVVCLDIKMSDSVNIFQNQYFCKINELCKDHNVHLICVTTPIYTAGNFICFQKFMYAHGIDYYDCSNVISDSHYFCDNLHLNPSGAKLFTAYIETLFVSKKCK